MNSVKPSAQSPSFDASGIKPLSVIYVPYTFAGKGYAEWKHFVVLTHQNGHAICLKTTTQVNYYLGNKSKLLSCVYLKFGTVPEFSQDTIVEPDNQFPIEHGLIEGAYLNPKFRVFSLPPDFYVMLCEAVQRSETLKWPPKKRLMEILGMR